MGTSAIQFASNYNAYVSGGTTSQAFASAVALGDKLAVMLVARNPGATTGVTSNRTTGGWTKHVAITDPGTTFEVSIWSADATSAGACTVTAATTSDAVYNLAEFPAQGAARGAGQAISGTSGSPTVSVPGTTSGDLVFGGSVNTAGVTQSGGSCGTNSSFLSGSPFLPQWVMIDGLSSGGTINFSSTGATTAWSAVGVAFAPAGGGGGGVATILSNQLPPSPHRTPSPSIFQGSVTVAQSPVATIASSFPQNIPRSHSGPSLFAGFGQAAQIAAVIAALPSPLPVAPTPGVFSGSANDPGTVSLGGVNAPFLPDDQQAPVPPALFAGVVPTAAAPASTVLANGSTPPAPLPPVPSLAGGAGQAAQPPVVAFANPAHTPFRLPPLPTLLAGFGAAAQAPFIAAGTLPPATPALPPTPAIFAGFGQAAQAPVVLGFAMAPFVGLPPNSLVFAGIASPSPQAPAVFATQPAPVSPLPPTPVTVPGVAPVSAPVGMVIPRALNALAPVPTVAPVRFSGFGQAAQPAVIYSAQPPQAALLPLEPGSFAGVTPPGPQAAITRAIDALPPAAAPVPTLVKGSGQAAQPPVIITASAFAPAVELLPAGRLVAGFGQTALLPVPFVATAPQTAPATTLPPQPLWSAGFGQAAQPATVTVAASGAPALELLIQPRWFAGFGQPVQPLSPFIAVAAEQPFSASSPPANTLLSGVAAPVQPVGIIYQAPRPHAQTSAPSPVLTAGVQPPQGAGALLRSPDVRAAQLPPANVLSAGFGFPTQVAAIITVPFVTTGITLLPPGTSIFAGFGIAGFPFSVAAIGRCSPLIDATGIGRLTPFIKVD